MVTLTRPTKLCLVLLVLCIPFLSMMVSVAQAQITYRVDQEWVQIWINTDGSIDLRYNITLTYLSGLFEGIVTVGMPKSGFTIVFVRNLQNATLQYSSALQGSGIDVTLNPKPSLGSPSTFIVYAKVPGMVSKDTTNPGNVGMLFYPTTFSTATGSIASLRVKIVLPTGVNSTSVKYPSGAQWDSVGIDGNNLYVYWARTSWSPGQTFTSGVSFPEKYMSLAAGPSIWVYTVAAFAIIAVVGVAAAVAIPRLGKAAYEKPRISVEALGSLKGLTAVEAGVVLGGKPVRVLTMILYGLLLKRIVTVTETDPLLKLKKTVRPEGEPSPTLRYYEIDYLKAIQPEGTLDDKILAQTYVGLTDTVNKKLRGYSREDTVNYYRSIANQAWTQVTQAGTPELKGDALDKNIEWLLTDEKFNDKFKTVFPPNMVILPLPGWWWYWGIPRYPIGQTGVPTSTSTMAKPIPGQDFANNVVRGVETTSNNLVKNVQEFANRLIPAQQAAVGEQSVRGKSGCVCACHACACACACVSCACACAGGGAR